MTVKEANKRIDAMNDTVNNLQKFFLLSDEEQEELAEKLGLNQPIKQMVNMAVNSIISHRNILKDKIEDAIID